MLASRRHSDSTAHKSARLCHAAKLHSFRQPTGSTILEAWVNVRGGTRAHRDASQVSNASLPVPAEDPSSSQECQSLTIQNPRRIHTLLHTHTEHHRAVLVWCRLANYFSLTAACQPTPFPRLHARATSPPALYYTDGGQEEDVVSCTLEKSRSFGP